MKAEIFKGEQIAPVRPDHASPRRRVDNIRCSSERAMLSVALALAQRQQSCDKQQQSATHAMAAPSTAAAPENGTCTCI